jgi:hypothetical protein
MGEQTGFRSLYNNIFWEEEMSIGSRGNVSSYLLAGFVVLLSGCAGGITRMESMPAESAAPTPLPGKAMVVFMRPSGLGFAVQSTVYEVKGTEVDMIGIVAAKTKVAYQVDPGKRVFMAVGESADFMSANVQAGRTYYVNVSPRFGMWKARFALGPIHREKLDSDAFKSDFGDTRWVMKTAATDEWFAANRSSIQSKRSEYYADWLKTPENERALLRAEDGR